MSRQKMPKQTQGTFVEAKIKFCAGVTVIDMVLFLILILSSVFTEFVLGPS